MTLNACHRFPPPRIRYLSMTHATCSALQLSTRLDYKYSSWKQHSIRYSSAAAVVVDYDTAMASLLAVMLSRDSIHRIARNTPTCFMVIHRCLTRESRETCVGWREKSRGISQRDVRSSDCRRSQISAKRKSGSIRAGSFNETVKENADTPKRVYHTQRRRASCVRVRAWLSVLLPFAMRESGWAKDTYHIVLW